MSGPSPMEGAGALDRLLSALEYGGKKEDADLLDAVLERHRLARVERADLIRAILAGPGFERFFLDVVEEVRPFALMVREVYGFLSRQAATTRQRADQFRVTAGDAEASLAFDLSGFPRSMEQILARLEGEISIVGIRAPEEGYSPFRAIDPCWDGDFYDQGFHRIASYAGTILARADAEQARRIRALVDPIFDRLRALTSLLAHDEFGGVAPSQLAAVRGSYLNGQREELELAILPSDRYRLDLDDARAVFSRAVPRDPTALSGPAEETVWDREKFTLLGLTIACQLWEQRSPRADHQHWLARRLDRPFDDIDTEKFCAVLESAARSYASELDAALPVTGSEGVHQVREALIEFVTLPFWKDRWFLYELWTLCKVLEIASNRWPVRLVGLETRADGCIDWSLPGGAAEQPVATIGESGDVECWSQRKTMHPDSGLGLEPDLRLTRSDAARTDLVIVENKDRRTPAKSDMAEILERYVTGTGAGLVCLVNYDRFTRQTHDLANRFPGRRVEVVSRFRPSELPAWFEVELSRILEDALAESEELPSPVEEAAVSEQRSIGLTRVVLEWSSEAKLELWTWALTRDGQIGSLARDPFLLTAPGRIELRLPWDSFLHRVEVAARDPDGGSLHAANATVRVIQSDDPDRELRLPGGGSWWHVLSYMHGRPELTNFMGVPAFPRPADRTRDGAGWVTEERQGGEAAFARLGDSITLSVAGDRIKITPFALESPRAGDVRNVLAMFGRLQEEKTDTLDDARSPGPSSCVLVRARVRNLSEGTSGVVHTGIRDAWLYCDDGSEHRCGWLKIGRRIYNGLDIPKRGQPPRESGVGFLLPPQAVPVAMSIGDGLWLLR